MSILTGTETVVELKALFASTGTYFEDNDAAKARQHVSVCTALLLELPRRSQHGTEEAEWDVSALENSKRQAVAFLQSGGGGTEGSNVTYCDASNLR